MPVLHGVDAVAKGHANFSRALSWPHESGFRYVLHGNGDVNREFDPDGAGVSCTDLIQAD